MTIHTHDFIASPTPKLDAIQQLRALAASVVVLGHAMGFAVVLCKNTGCTFQRTNLPTGAGVDLFFLISGFIMVLSSTKMFGRPRGAQDFVIRRLVRIVPLYWGVTTLWLLVCAIKLNVAFPRLAAVFASYLFFPFDTNGIGNGFAFPIVELGWTLNYEMMFYVLFALFMHLGRRNTVISVSTTLALLVLIGALFSPLSVAINFWTQPIILTFAVGMWLALLHIKGKLRLPVIARLSFLLASIGIFTFFPLSAQGSITPNNFDRLMSWGLPSALLLIAATSGNLPLGRSISTVLVKLGDSSYCLYLIHPFWFMVVGLLVNHIPILHTAYIIIGISVIGAMTASMIVHLLIERPCSEWLTRRLRRLNVPIDAVPLPDVR